jgi:hypothetical protein
MFFRDLNFDTCLPVRMLKDDMQHSEMHTRQILKYILSFLCDTKHSSHQSLDLRFAAYDCWNKPIELPLFWHHCYDLIEQMSIFLIVSIPIIVTCVMAV